MASVEFCFGWPNLSWELLPRFFLAVVIADKGVVCGCVVDAWVQYGSMDAIRLVITSNGSTVKRLEEILKKKISR